MRFRGGGVGHKSTREATDLFKMDRDRLDVGATLDSDDVEIELDGPGDDEPENDEIVDEDTVDQQEEDDYGYTKEDSEPDEDAEEAEVGQNDEPEDDTDEDLGPEDDGGAVDPFMDELGYADM